MTTNTCQPKKRWKKAVVYAVVFFVFGWYVSLQPLNDRDWKDELKTLASATIDGNDITIHNVRNNFYRAVDDFDIIFEDRNYDLDKLERVWYLVEPFEDWRGPAHTLLSFEFEDNEFVSISVEIRKEKGEDFSPWKGLFRNYEIIYVVADERDVIGLRANHRKDSVYLYPIKTTQERAQALFLDMLDRINTLQQTPEFYNTITSTCTTNIVSHVNKLVPGRVPFSYKVLLPGYSDELAHDIGLIDTDLTLQEAREKFLINKKAAIYADTPEFSKRIRE